MEKDYKSKQKQDESSLLTRSSAGKKPEGMFSGRQMLSNFPPMESDFGPMPSYFGPMELRSIPNRYLDQQAGLAPASYGEGYVIINTSPDESPRIKEALDKKNIKEALRITHYALTTKWLPKDLDWATRTTTGIRFDPSVIAKMYTVNSPGLHFFGVLEGKLGFLGNFNPAKPDAPAKEEPGWVEKAGEWWDKNVGSYLKTDPIMGDAQNGGKTRKADPLEEWVRQNGGDQKQIEELLDAFGGDDSVSKTETPNTVIYKTPSERNSSTSKLPPKKSPESKPKAPIPKTLVGETPEQAKERRAKARQYLLDADRIHSGDVRPDQPNLYDNSHFDWKTAKTTHEIIDLDTVKILKIKKK